MIRAVFFDLDDTLIDAAPAFEAGRQAAFKAAVRQLPNMSESDLRAAWFPVHQELFRELDAGAMAMAQVREARFKHVLQRLNIQNDELAEHMNAILGATQLDMLQPFDDVGILDVLRTRGIYLGIITNGAGDAASDSQRTKAERLGLLDQVDSFWVSDEIGYRKPNVRAFLPALQTVGAAPNDCLYVGDGLVTDILGANAAGMRSVLIARRGQALETIFQVKPWRIIQSLWQIQDLLEEDDSASSINEA